jgi:D-3-phosphoglycerate dehydrogenase
MGELMIDNTLNVYITEPDIYRKINFSKYNRFSTIYKNGKGFVDGLDYSIFNVVCIGLEYYIDDEFINKFENLKYIVSPTTGIDHIDITNKNIKIINLNPNEITNVSSTAEHTIALMLSLIRKIPFVDHTNTYDRYLYRGNQLKGKTIGIFGLGRIGSMVRDIMQVMGLNVLTYDITSTEKDKIKILNESDIITIHLPLNESTVKFLSSKYINNLHKKPYIINTSRPQIIDKEFIIYCLKYNMLSGVAMDFVNYDYCTTIDPEFVEFLGKNLVLTPHIAGNTWESIIETSNIVINKLVKEVCDRDV